VPCGDETSRVAKPLVWLVVKLYTLVAVAVEFVPEYRRQEARSPPQSTLTADSAAAPAELTRKGNSI
jgi:hypothetical protein